MSRVESSNHNATDLLPTVSLAVLVLRIGAGFVFFMHGWQKLVDNGIGSTQAAFDGMGAPLPDLSAPLVTFADLVGGVALVAGAFTQLAALILLVDMLFAMFIVHVENGFFTTEGGYELVFLLGIAALTLMQAGPGAFSVDRAIRLPSLFDVRTSSHQRA